MTDEERREYEDLINKAIKGGNMSVAEEERMNKLGKLSVQSKQPKR